MEQSQSALIQPADIQSLLLNLLRCLQPDTSVFCFFLLPVKAESGKKQGRNEAALESEWKKPPTKTGKGIAKR